MEGPEGDVGGLEAGKHPFFVAEDRMVFEFEEVVWLEHVVGGKVWNDLSSASKNAFLLHVDHFRKQLLDRIPVSLGLFHFCPSLRGAFGRSLLEALTSIPAKRRCGC